MRPMVVTGGAGFIGSNFVRHAFRATDASIVILDALTYAGFKDSLADLLEDPRITFVEGDICDAPLVEGLFEEHRPGTLLNFAAETHVDRSIDGPAAFVRTNIVGAFTLLDAARRFHEGLPDPERAAFRFLHVSTDEVYGSLGPTGAFREDTPYAPNSPYAASKAAADHLVRSYRETYGLPVLITNCSNNYGPYQFPEKLIPLMLLNALEARDLPIYGDGLNVRDWLYVGDHCEAILQVLLRGEPGEKYNIGGCCQRTNIEVVDAICRALEALQPAAGNPAMQHRGLADYRELKTFVDDRRGHDRRYAIDAGKMRDALGWAPAHDFDAGIRDTVRWYLENRTWCEAVQRSSDYGRERLGLSG